MYYRHDGNYKIIEQSTVPLEGENTLYNGYQIQGTEEFRIDLYDVTMGFISEDNGSLLRVTQKPKHAEILITRIIEIETEAKDRIASSDATIDIILTEIIPELMGMIKTGGV